MKLNEEANELGQTRKFNSFYGRKIEQAATKWGLEKKIQASEQRNWQAISDIRQHADGQWCCLMELQPPKEMEASNG